MRTALAFVETGGDALVSVAGPLVPVDSPRAGAPAFFAPHFSMAADAPWWYEADPLSPATLSRDGVARAVSAGSGGRGEPLVGTAR